MTRIDVCVICGLVIEPAARYFTDFGEPVHMLCKPPDLREVADLRRLISLDNRRHSVKA